MIFFQFVLKLLFGRKQAIGFGDVEE